MGRSNKENANATPEPLKKLPPDQEMRYRQWMRDTGQTRQQGQNVDESLTGRDYDYRRYFQKYGRTPHKAGEHYPDEFKLPSHKTFSDESVFAVGANKARAGRWNGDTFVPPNEEMAMPSRSNDSNKDSPRGAMKGRGAVVDKAKNEEMGRRAGRLAAAESGLLGVMAGGAFGPVSKAMSHKMPLERHYKKIPLMKLKSHDLPEVTVRAKRGSIRSGDESPIGLSDEAKADAAAEYEKHGRK